MRKEGIEDYSSLSFKRSRTNVIQLDTNNTPPPHQRWIDLTDIPGIAMDEGIENARDLAPEKTDGMMMVVIGGNLRIS